MASPYLRIAPFLAVLAIGCGVDLPTSPAPVQPKSGEPATIELSASPGVGPNGGTATITARVLDGLFATLPNQTVTFTATAGTLASEAVQTDDKGIARTTLTATPGTVKVTAAAGSVHSTETAVSIQPVNVFVPPPPGPVPPAPLPDPTPQPPAAQYGVVLVASPSSVVTGTPTNLSATVSPVFGAPPVTSWVWDCDIATPATDATTPNSASCTYGTAGTFTAGVRVTGGSIVGFAITTVTVIAPPVPAAPSVPAVTVRCAQPTPPAMTINCNVSATLDGVVVPSGSIVAANWDFGDAGTATSLNNAATHVYGVANTYTVLVTNVSVPGTTAKGIGSTNVAVLP